MSNVSVFQGFSSFRDQLTQPNPLPPTPSHPDSINPRTAFEKKSRSVEFSQTVQNTRSFACKNFFLFFVYMSSNEFSEISQTLLHPCGHCKQWRKHLDYKNTLCCLLILHVNPWDLRSFIYKGLRFLFFFFFYKIIVLF